MTRSPWAGDAASDAAVDHRIALGATAAATVAVTLYTTLQAYLLHDGAAGEWGAGMDLAASAGAAVLAPIVMLSGVHLLRPERYGHLLRWLCVLALGALAALTLAGSRAALATLLHRDAAMPSGWGAYLSAGVAAACAVGLGLVQVDIARRIRLAEREQSIAQARAAGLVAELQEEELRLRYELAETIHGSVQGTFVVMEARLRHLALSTPGDRPVAAELTAVAAQLELLREKELRALSGRLYPVDLERGLAPAVRALVVRLPPSVAVTAPEDEVFAAFEHRLSHEARVLVVRVIEDALSNALRHGSADHVVIHARAGSDLLHVAVTNNGTPPPAQPPLSGLARLRRRAHVLGGELVLEALGGGRSKSGARLKLTLPLGCAAPGADATAAPRTRPPAP